MKATLEFNLPDDEWEFDKAVKGSNLHIAMNEFKNRLRNMLKHDDYVTDAHQEVYDIFINIMNEHDINFD